MAQAVANRKGKIQTDFHGLIQILAKNLYPQEDMFIRELIQNAHDSIVKRQTLGNAPSGIIDIVADRTARTIIFRDNGAGMTEQEIVDYLATIGRSGTGELRQQLEERDRARAQSLIGQFGIGFLSAFVAAERLVVETCSAMPGRTALRWEIAGGPDYELSSGERAEVGTDVILYLKSDSLGITNADALRKSIRKYADFIPFPISINNQGPVNTMHAPWHLNYSSGSERTNAYKRWVEERFPDIALEIIPVDIEAPFIAKGVMYISDRHLTDVNMPGMVDIYQARMFIKESDRNLLPSWAKFIRGVIDSPALTPTAARDAVQEDHAHAEIKAALGRLIIDALQRMSREDPPRFRRLMEWHHYTIKGIAIEFEDFFNAIADTVVFESNIEETKEGMLFRSVTIPEYLRMQNETDDSGRKVVYYISEQGASAQFYRLAKARDLLALNASLIFDEKFLTKYTAHHSDEIVLRRLDIAEGTAIFEALSDEERRPFLDTEYRLRVLFRRNLSTQETVVQSERFSPPEMPCVITQSEDLEIARQLERLTGPLGLISSGLSEALNEVLGVHKRRQRPVVLHLNATSVLIKRLMLEDFNDAFIQDAWMTLYNNAAMYGQHVLTVDNLEVLHDQTLRWLDKVLEMRQQNRAFNARIAQIERDEPKRVVHQTAHTSLFVMIPFGDEYRVIEEALRTVFEDEPYYFQIIAARDRTINQNLFENVKQHMRMVRGFIADISDLNANVMLELGITEVDPEGRPVIVLHRAGSEKPPADLLGRLYIEYELPSKQEVDRVGQIVAQLRKKFENIETLEKLRNTRTERYLSTIWLKRKIAPIQLGPKEIDSLCKGFVTIEKLQNARASERCDNNRGWMIEPLG